MPSWLIYHLIIGGLFTIGTCTEQRPGWKVWFVIPLCMLCWPILMGGMLAEMHRRMTKGKK